MRCYICTHLSVSILCKKCQKHFLTTHMQTRTIGTLDVISFYSYNSIEALLHTKHKPEGYRIYKALANITMKPFIEEFIESDDRDIYILGIDEHVKSGYSHVSVLCKSMKTLHSHPLHSKLMAQNRVNYSGKSLQYRMENPRNFKYTGKQNIDVILVDDIITTGITLQEAQSVLQQNGVNVLFALTLANVDD
ncbi:MAG: Phosphoribosyltransferase [uncultured Sulfurovum sp.]|uniref:Phosphoribosyltransferase n=1 Tax=uncultured Sulfurovum sp. TaxID=269237 RepID=A0A6S6TQR7_9BACT|nr:MAG: Phosphoribosyltransferase [uncultured Sulfurovum sp.]